MPADRSRPDAVLLLSFGGPEGPDDVLPFLENVTRGRGVPRERLEEVAEQYLRFGGRSPINDQCRALLDALRSELARRGHDVPVYWGNRNWEPYVEDTLAEIAADGHRSVVALATSAYSSYSSCRQYLEDLGRAQAAVGAGGADVVPEVRKVRPYWNHPGFVRAQTEHLVAALADLDDDARAGAHLVFTAHSLPVSMAASSDYETQLNDAAALVVAGAGWHGPWDVAFQSRSGPPQVPWLEPDIGDRLRALATDGVRCAVVVPVGFVSDHQEVVFDLDTQAAEIAAELGMRFVRVPTVGTHPTFVAGLVDLLEEHLAGGPGFALGPLGPRVWPCEAGCCPAPVRGPTRPG